MQTLKGKLGVFREGTQGRHSVSGLSSIAQRAGRLQQLLLWKG